jgi:hypothetical protein
MAALRALYGIAQQQLARVVSELVRELEDGVTQAMLNVCHMLHS